MIDEYARLRVAAFLLGVALPPFIIWVRRNNWQFSIRSILVLTVVAALLFGWIGNGWNSILPEWRVYCLLELVSLFLWPFFISWILSSFLIPWVFGSLPITTKGQRKEDNRPGCRLDFRRKVRRRTMPRRGLFRAFPWIPFPLYVVVLSVVCSSTMLLMYSLCYGDIVRSEVNEIGVSLRAFEHVVNGLFIVYLLVDFWGRVTAEDEKISVWPAAYLIAIFCLLANHMAIGCFPWDRIGR